MDNKFLKKLVKFTGVNYDYRPFKSGFMIDGGFMFHGFLVSKIEVYKNLVYILCSQTDGYHIIASDKTINESEGVYILEKLNIP